jgi:uncharacterized membrane protein
VWPSVHRFFTELWRSGPLFFLIGVSPGAALWPLASGRYPSLGKNDMTVEQRHAALGWEGASLVAMSLVVVALFLRDRRRAPDANLADTVARFNHYAFIVIALPVISFLCALSIERTMPILTATLIALLAFMAGLFVYRVRGLARFAPPEEPFQPAEKPWLARGVLGAAMLAYALLFTYYSLLQHRNMVTAFLDIGLYDNLVWNTLHGNFLGTTFAKSGYHGSAHFDPILALVALPYALAPGSQTLLVMQTLWLCSGALGVWAIARRRLVNEWLAALCGVVYLLHPALHGPNLYDFHSMTLSIPFIVWTIYALDAERPRLYWPMLALLLLCREDMSLLSCFIGAYAILSGHTRTGLATVLVSLVYLAIVKAFFMTDSSLLMAKTAQSYEFGSYFKEMIPYGDEGVRGLVITLFSNPLHALKVVCNPARIMFFVHMFLPLLALPLLAPRKLVLMIYGFIFLGVVSRSAVFSMHFQYTAVLFPVLMTALPDGYRRVVDSRRSEALGLLRPRLASALAAGILVATIGTSVKHGAIVPNSSFSAGFIPLTRTHSQAQRERYEWVQKMAAQLGPDASITASEGLGPHLTNRKHIYFFPELGTARYLFVIPARLNTPAGKKTYARMVQNGEVRLIERAHDIELYEILTPPRAGG